MADADPITAYRPSVSNPAQLSAAGQLELELGGVHQNMDDTQRNSLPYLLKLAFNKEWGILIGGNAIMATHDATGSAHGWGDTDFTVKRAWIMDEATALGMEFGVKLSTAGDKFGTDNTDYTLNTIYSKDMGAIHMDLNLNDTSLGFADPGTSHSQIGWASSFSTALSQKWGTNIEFSGTHQGGVANAVQLLAALTYSPNKRLTFDFGFIRAFQPSPGNTSLFSGVVFPLGKLF